jgi:hypothetical protein
MPVLKAIERGMQPGGLLICGKKVIDRKKVLRKQYILFIEGCNA